jgi:hypothetical protein
MNYSEIWQFIDFTWSLFQNLCMKPWQYKYKAIFDSIARDLNIRGVVFSMDAPKHISAIDLVKS